MKTVKIVVAFTVPNGLNPTELADWLLDHLCQLDTEDEFGGESWYESCDGTDVA